MPYAPPEAPKFGAMLRRVVKFLILGILFASLPAFAATRYIAQTAGTFSGGSACNGQTAITPATWNSTSESPGDLSWVCGTLTGSSSTLLTFPSAGTSGNLITLKFDTGATITYPAIPTSGAIVDNKNYTLIDGNSLAGTVTSTTNGDCVGCTSTTQSVGLMMGCSNCEVRNLNVGPIFQRSTSDTSSNGNATVGIEFNEGNNLIADGNHVTNAFELIFTIYTALTSLQVYNNVLDYSSHYIVTGDDNTGDTATGVLIYGNTLGPHFNVWQDLAQTMHADGIFIFAGNSGSSATALVYNNSITGDMCNTPPTGLNCSGYIYLDGNTNTIVFNNSIQHQTSSGTGPEGLVMVRGTANNFSGVHLLNNTVIGAPNAIQMKNGGGTYVGTGLVIENNIWDAGQYLYGFGPTNFASLGSSNYNVFYLPTSDVATKGVDTSPTFYATLANWQAADSQDAASTAGNPMLNSGLVPQSGSSAIGLGTNLYSFFGCSSPVIPGLGAGCSDIAANARPFSGNWTAGAYQFGGGGTVNTPTCTPGTGTYSNNQGITCTIQGGAKGCYTTSGTPPTAPTPGTCGAGSTQYSSAITISTTATNLQILATESGFTNSSIASYTYTLTAATPTASPIAGTYSSAQTVTLSTTTAGASIYYSIGGTPTCSSTLYTAPITVAMTETLEALACKSGYNSSAVGSFVYTITSVSYTWTQIVAGPGTIISSPSGISCTSAGGAGCTATFPNGTVVTMTATPATGYYLRAWQGACTGTAGCSLTLSGNVSVTGTFLLVYSAYTGGLLVALPATPNLGNLVKTNAPAYDTSYPSGTSSPFIRCTDTQTAGSSSGPYKPLSAGIGGSGDGMPLFNANSTLLHVNNNGSANYIIPFNPATLVCGKAITTSQNTAGGGSINVSQDFGQGYFDWVNPNWYYGSQGSTVTLYSINPSTGAYTVVGPAVDFQYAIPQGSLVAPWAASHAYTAGQYVTAALSFPDWAASHAYPTLGTLIVPLTNNPLGCAFKLVTAGTSNSTERVWSTSGACVAASNTTLPDGSATWRNLGGPPVFVFQLTSASGTSGGTTPTWIPSTGRPDLMTGPGIGTTASDNGLTWTNVGPEVPQAYRDVAGNSYDPTGSNTRFAQDTSTNSYGYNNNYTNYDGGQGSAIWSIAYNAATTQYVTLNTATGWQSITTCTGPTTCSAMTPVGSYTNITSGGCGYFIHNEKGSWSNDYVAISQQGLLVGIPGPCLSGNVNNWSPFLPFNAASEAPYLGNLNHFAQGNTVMVNVGQNPQTFGYTTGVYSILYQSTNPQAPADIFTSWQPTPCDSTAYTAGYVYTNPPCTIANGYDSHMSRAYNPGGTDVAPIAGSIYNNQTLNPNPYAPFQGEAVAIPTYPTWTATPAGQNAPYRFTHEWASGANTFFDAQFAISQLSVDGKFLAFTTDFWNQSTQTCSFGDTSGNSTSVCGTPWVKGTVYASGAMINPFSSTGGSGTNYGVWQVTTPGTAATAPAWTVCNAGTAGNALSASGVTYTCIGTSTARSDVIIVALASPGITVTPNAPTILGLFADDIWPLVP
jgi:hypothetical protein